MKNRKKWVYSSLIILAIGLLLSFFIVSKIFQKNYDYEVPDDNNILETDEKIPSDNATDIVPNLPDEGNLPSDSDDASDNYVPNPDPSDNITQTKPDNSNNNSSNNITTDKKPNNSNNNSETIPPQDNNLDNNQSNNNNDVTKPDDKPIVTDPEPQKPMTLSEKVESMTIEEKIAQMLIISFNGTTVNSNIQKSLAYNPGGVILFANNIGTYNNTVKLVKDVQSLVNIPLLVSIDQEGGRVQRIKDMTGVTNIPPMWEVGQSGDVNKAYATGKTIGSDLKQFGINMNFAPVLDIVASESANVIGNRSFGSSADLVAKMGVHLGRGLSDSGVIPVYKHFPGHGSTVTDSHYDLPVLTLTKEELLANDLIPFKEAIKNNAKVIMIGHLAIPNITNDKTPASLSKIIITDLLKNELGYKGLVITDALNMKALTNNYTEKRIYELAINAGVDILLMPSSVENAINLIKESIKEGTIKETQINNSVTKILSLKHEYLSYEYK